MRKPKVGILTTFTGSDEAYSLVNVVSTQLQMLVDGGYTPVLFVAPSFTGTGIWNKAEIRKTVMPDATTPEIVDSLREQIQDIDVMLCHDIVFLSQHQKLGKCGEDTGKGIAYSVDTLAALAR